MTPKDLLYAETHEWVRVADEGGRKVATVGITDPKEVLRKVNGDFAFGGHAPLYQHQCWH